MDYIYEASKILEIDDIEKLREISIIKKYKKGDIYSPWKDTTDKYLILLSVGTINASVTNTKHNKVHIRDFEAPQLIGEPSIFVKIDGHFHMSFREDGVITAINLEKFKKYFLKDSKVSEMMMLSLSKKIIFLINLIYNEKVYSISEKIMLYIYNNREILRDIKQSDIAKELNMPLQSFCRIANKLKAQGMIDVVHRKIVITDIDKLKEALPKDTLM